MPLKEKVCLPLGTFPLLVGCSVDVVAGAGATFLTTRWKLYVEHGRATRQKESGYLKL